MGYASLRDDVVENQPTDPDVIVRQTVDDLHLLVAAVRLYGPTHKQTTQIAASLEEHLCTLEDVLHELELSVTRDHLYWGDQAVYQDNDDRDGLARTLQREGIVGLTVLPGAPRDELLAFAGIVGTNLNLPRWEEETLASLLWQANLQHITYEAVEYLSDAQELSESIARGEGSQIAAIMNRLHDPTPPEPREDERPSLDGEVDIEEIAGPPAPSDHPLESNEAEALAQARAQLRLPDPEYTPDQNLAALDLNRWLDSAEAEIETNPDLAHLRDEVEGDTEQALLERVVEILVLGGARGRPEFPSTEAMALLSRALEWDEQRGKQLRKPVTRMVMRLSEGEIPLLQPGQPAMNAWLDACTAPDAFFDLATRLDAADPGDQRLLRQFLAGGGGRRAQLLIKQLGGRSPAAKLSWVMDELASTVKGELAPIAAGIRHRPVDEAYTLIDLLRRVDDPTSRAQLFELMQHDAPDVRAAALRALPFPLPPQVLPRVVELLTDRSEVVRGAVVEQLRGQSSQGARMAVEEMVEGPSFEQATPEVQASLAHALCAVDPDGAVRVLQGILARHARLFAGAGARPQIEACAQALAKAGTVAARQTLLQAARSPFPTLRKVCRAALEEKKSR